MLRWDFLLQHFLSVIVLRSDIYSVSEDQKRSRTGGWSLLSDE
jgi:hypothetical protein